MRTNVPLRAEPPRPVGACAAKQSPGTADSPGDCFVTSFLAKTAYFIAHGLLQMTLGTVLGILLLVAVSTVSGCVPPAPVKVGALPTLDALPLILNSDKPIFEENGLVLTTTFFPNSSELNEALKRGEIDAAITDLIGAILLDSGEERSKIVRVAMTASPGRPKFALFVAGPDPATSARELQQRRIAVLSEPSHRYAADRLLAEAGVAKWTRIEVETPEIGIEMLQKGEVGAVLLSEPLFWLAAKNGCRTVLDDGNMMLGQTVVAFNQRIVWDKPVLVRKFLVAYEQATRELNVRPEQYRFLATGLTQLPVGVTDSRPLPVFPFPGQAPTESDIESANAWLVQKGLLSRPVPYNQAVNPGFLWDPYEFRPAACCGW